MADVRSKEFFMDDKFGARLRRLRTQAGLSQTEFAARLRTSLPTIHRLEAREHYPHDDILQALIREFKADPRWLLTGDPEAGPAVGITVRKPGGYGGGTEIIGRVHLPGLPEHGKILQVSGDDLLPTIHSSDYVVYLDDSPEGGEIVLYRCEWGEVRARRFSPKEGGLLIAEHPDYPPIRAGLVQMIGRVIQVIRHLSVVSP